MADSGVALFCQGADFCQQVIPAWPQRVLPQGGSPRVRRRRLCLSEILTILSAGHTSHSRDCKAGSTFAGQGHGHDEFPGLVSSSGDDAAPRNGDQH